MGFVGERAIKRDTKIRRPVVVSEPFPIMFSSWLILALCKWKVLDTVLATLGCSRQRLPNSLILAMSVLLVVLRSSNVRAWWQGKCRRHK